MEEQKKQEVQKEEGTKIKLEYGNVHALQLQLLNRLVENTNKIIELLQKKTE